MELYDPPPQAIEASPTFTGTVTMPDGSTWASTGLADAANYTTSSTAMLNIAPTWSFSSTANGYSAAIIAPVVVPTGASAGNGQATSIGGNLGTTSLNIGTLRGLSGSLVVNAGYSGTLTTGIGVLGFVTNSGVNPITNAEAILASMPSNGNGLTTGTVNNFGFVNSTSITAAAAGGTINNYGYAANVPGGSGAGTTNNYGVYINLNGGSGGGGTTNNYALRSDSTAPSLLSGTLTMAIDRSLLFTAQTSSAGAQLGTLTNAPTAGNPGFWLKVTIGGVSYALPAWAG